MESQRERFGSRLGFILISAGCAIGLGNVWRFPYITGQYGGAAFVLIYILFLVMFSLPLLVMEFSVGRASRKGIARSFDVLEPAGTRWHAFKWIGLAGNYLLMMFYTVVAGWMLSYVRRSAAGTFEGLDAAGVGAVFNQLLASPLEQVFWLAVVVGIGLAVTGAGLQRGVERVTKIMMGALFVVLLMLCVRAVTLPGAEAGLEFYLVPDFGKLFAGDGLGAQLSTFSEAVYAAMAQAFFTLSIGIGSMSIFGSYIGKDRSLFGEALRIGGLDTAVALVAGLIIFPACFAFGVTPDSGPGLVFVTLPGVFNQMWGGQLWGTLFFLFMSFAALSSVIAVFENIMGFSIDQWGFSRRRAVIVNGIALFVLSVPCILGFNLWSGFEVSGIGNVQSLEDFLLSNNILLVGALVFLLFCVSKRGWGWESFIAEADTGEGARFPRAAYAYMKFVVPALIVVVFVAGWIPVLATWMG
ncbi:sodium-dependent transporter [Slackia exigua]|uniref:Transporter n=1 Tax=Slackia exigua (strain ATCC 700122 / DSM 15923 / CIP 105133 / JCM 11022 / KCTC 5966 / S-7) TaxID=649764 RepID=D0WFT7_SLAES|nr:sodium-dependent transporter [Slackia exigua]EEZ61350.1 Sodium:neurotransmitter symporter family protein [Slackia exigua ATCC 700122]STN98994.1 Na+-dependent transporters of the SNF family [Slackia exigua]